MLQSCEQGLSEDIILLIADVLVQISIDVADSRPSAQNDFAFLPLLRLCCLSLHLFVCLVFVLAFSLFLLVVDHVVVVLLLVSFDRVLVESIGTGGWRVESGAWSA